MPLIDPAQLKQVLAAHSGRFDVDALDSCDSTSSELLRRAARGAPSGTVVVADQQASGRGRRGRAWVSSPEDSLTFSLLWRLPPGRMPAGLSLAIGVAVAQALHQLGARGVCLKWPNDILLRAEAGHVAKLAGVLVELTSDRRGTLACIGIGLNLMLPDGDFAQPVAGLTQAMPQQPERHQLLAALLLSLARVLDHFCVAGFASIREDWLNWHAWQDHTVCLQEEGEAVLQGICRGVDEDGALLLETAGGMQRVLAGDLSLRVA